MKKTKYLRFGIVFLVPVVFIFSHCFNSGKPADPRGAAYAGSASCLRCHKNIAQNYFHSAHFLTSRPATEATIHGSFKPGANTVYFNNNIKAVMQKDSGGFYQASYANGKLTHRQRFDIVFGSKRAETYLSWKGDVVYQLPISYFKSMHSWANSPDYTANFADFNRVIGARCFECHSSYIRSIAGPGGAKTDSLDRGSLIMGIDCERCHGPGAQHVNFQTANPLTKRPMYIKSISALTRAQRMDLCSVCHSGNKKMMTRSTFEFKPGDTLDNFNTGTRFHKYQEVSRIDVHGNQAKLLTSSKCFINGKIECATCHTIHDNGVKSVQLYSAYCTGCHTQAKHNFCKLAGKLGSAINNNCIDCHMPMQTSKAVIVNTINNQVISPFQARTHLITIYPEETAKIMAWMKNTPAGAVK